jgi:dihydrodipicolinate synthase/N-acetylneuraminate lyase
VTPARGAIAAALTPLRDGGAALDGDAFGSLYDFYAGSGLDGVLALGTTGEGILLSADERRRGAQLAIEAAAGRIRVLIHAGAQTTADTRALAAHAAEAGADGVAVVGPPYYGFDQDELFAHYATAAAACAPLPFYVYEFAARSGYATPVAVLDRLREHAPNFTGMKVSDQPWDNFTTYLLDGLDIFVGPEQFIAAGLAAGAAGAMSGLAGGLPGRVVEAVRTGEQGATEAAGELRAAVSRFPFQAALKLALGWQGVDIQPHVRQPLRQLRPDEVDALRTTYDAART